MCLIECGTADRSYTGRLYCIACRTGDRSYSGRLYCIECGTAELSYTGRLYCIDCGIAVRSYSRFCVVLSAVQQIVLIAADCIYRKGLERTEFAAS